MLLTDDNRKELVAQICHKFFPQQNVPDIDLGVLLQALIKQSRSPRGKIIQDTLSNQPKIGDMNQGAISQRALSQLLRSDYNQANTTYNKYEEGADSSPREQLGSVLRVTRDYVDLPDIFIAPFLDALAARFEQNGVTPNLAAIISPSSFKKEIDNEARAKILGNLGITQDDFPEGHMDREKLIAHISQQAPVGTRSYFSGGLRDVMEKERKDVGRTFFEKVVPLLELHLPITVKNNKGITTVTFSSSESGKISISGTVTPGQGKQPEKRTIEYPTTGLSDQDIRGILRHCRTDETFKDLGFSTICRTISIAIQEIRPPQLGRRNA